MKNKLTLKQQAFVGYYLGEARGNATEAARLAEYKGNEKTLQVVGAQNLLKPIVAAAIQAARAKLAGRAEITAESILADLEHVRSLAIEEKQFSVAARCTELRGKQIGMFPNRVEGKVEQNTTITIRDAAVSALDQLYQHVGIRGSDSLQPDAGKDGSVLPH